MRRGLLGGVLMLLMIAAAVASLPPLPPSAKQVIDRVSTEDATQEASTAAVLSAPLPKPTAVPFVRAASADPFEHRGTTPMELPAEPTTPVTGTPRPAAPVSVSGGK